MITKFSKWLLYSASYLFLYPILVIRLIIDNPDNNSSPLLQLIVSNLIKYKIIIFILALFFVVSITTLAVFRKVKPNSRRKKNLTENVTYEVCAFLIPCFISILTINLDLYGWIINLLIYVAFGVLAIKADVIHLCPFFLFVGYKLYKDDEKNLVLTKLSKEQYNQLCSEQTLGIQVKEITAKLYLVKQDKFN